jgi:hypothetical protein
VAAAAVDMLHQRVAAAAVECGLAAVVVDMPAAAAVMLAADGANQ